MRFYNSIIPYMMDKFYVAGDLNRFEVFIDKNRHNTRRLLIVFNPVKLYFF